MSDFGKAFNVLILHEGGFVDDPVDAGGPTKYGITEADFSAYFGRAATRDDIENLTKDTAALIYRKYFWDHLDLDKVLSQPLATVIFDQAVLTGTEGTVCRLQAILGVAVDGIMGLSTLNALEQEDGLKLAFKLLRSNIHHYADIVKKRPSDAKFFSGWADRVFSLLDYLFFNDLT